MFRDIQENPAYAIEFISNNDGKMVVCIHYCATDGEIKLPMQQTMFYDAVLFIGDFFCGEVLPPVAYEIEDTFEAQVITAKGQLDYYIDDHFIFKRLKSVQDMCVFGEIAIKRRVLHKDANKKWHNKSIARVYYEAAQEYINGDSLIAYYCSTVSDIVFSVIDYLERNGYKMALCMHCGKLFYTKTNKKKYCDRNSPYDGYKHLCCEQAVRNIRQKLLRRKNNVETYMNNYRPKYLFDFQQKCNWYTDRIKACSSVKALKEYEHFLYNPEFKKRWYSK